MKGFTHFITGLAVASCLPPAVREAAAGNPIPMVAGGLFGLLPDALDFKIVRFFARHDIEIVPDPLAPDMPMVAEAVAWAAGQARRTGRPVRLRLAPIRLGADAWQAYTVRFDPAGAVRAGLGPVQTTGGRPLAEAPAAAAEVQAPVRFVIGYEARVAVTILDGPLLALAPQPDGRVRVEFIPWHRAWSHSLLLAGGAGLVTGFLAGGTVGWVAALAWAAHSLVDQAGFLGAALLYPVSRTRFPGLQLARSNNAWANLALVWMAGLLLFWNLARFGLPPVPINGFRLFLLGGLLPLGLLARFMRRPPHEPA